MNGLILKPGDPRPCCGEPIKTSDPGVLLVLSWIARQKDEKTAPFPGRRVRVDSPGLPGGAGCGTPSFPGRKSRR